MTDSTAAPAPLRNQDGTVSCVWCRVTGPAAHFELTGPPEVRQNWACRQQNLCALRSASLLPLTPGQDNGELVHAVLTLVRELAQVARTDMAGRDARVIPPGGSYRDFRGMLSNADLARLHLVLAAARDQIQPLPGFPEYTEQARAEYGCRTCGAFGRDDCVTVTGGAQVPRIHGTYGPRWHAGRTL